ncbi:MAG: AMP-binding protein [Desulfobulbus sp.]|nr:AMP-binding protein [Desulfobulbus sp.]
MGKHAVLKALAARPADALVLAGGERNWSATEVGREIAALGERLADARVVAALADNGPAWAIADLATLAAGRVHLPLPGFFSPEQLRHALEQAAADTVLTDQPERIGALDLGFAITGRWQGLTWLRRPLGTANLPAGTAKISFTSGSTGAPKGVCLSADGLHDTAQALVRRLADLPLASHLAVLPLGLLLENVAGLYAPLLRAMPVHLPPLADLGWRGMAGFDPAALQAAVAAAQPGSLILVPELLKAWSLYLAASGQRPPASLCYVAVGGARIAPDALLQARALGIPAYQGYGLTECGSVVCLNRPGDDGDGVGRPLEHAGIRIAGGEVLIHSRAFLGYVGANARASGVEFASGDLGEISSDGHLHLAGRRKNLLITSFGRNISPEWVESVLLAQPAIMQAVVAGEAQAALSAVLAPRPGVSDDDIAAAVAAANQRLPDYARIGQWQCSPPFSPANGLATGNGRPLRAAIAARFFPNFPC